MVHQTVSPRKKVGSGDETSGKQSTAQTEGCFIVSLQLGTRERYQWLSSSLELTSYILPREEQSGHAATIELSLRNAIMKH